MSICGSTPERPPYDRTLFDPAPLPPVVEIPQSGRTIAACFAEFHRANPAIFHRLVRLSRGLKAAGLRKFGMKALFERLRWDHAVTTLGQPFKLNNNYASHYARKITAECPDLAGFFELRGDEEREHG